MSINAPVLNSARADIQFTIGTSLVETSCWFRKIDPPVTDESVTTLAFRVAVLMFVSGNDFASDCFCRQVTATDYSSGPGFSAVSTFGAGFGLQSTPTRAAHIALRLQNIVSPPRVAHRSYNFIPGVPEGQIDGNVINTDWADGRAANMTNLIVNLPRFGWRYVAVQRVEDGLVLPVGRTQDIVDVVVDTYNVRSVRKRVEEH